VAGCLVGTEVMGTGGGMTAGTASMRPAMAGTGKHTEGLPDGNDRLIRYDGAGVCDVRPAASCCHILADVAK
jgi:hypothetical protein